MLSLSPRYDLFRFALPKDFLHKEVYDKYNKIINKDPGVITDPINYLNESIQTITIPGISDILINQQQHSSNNIKKSNIGLGKINVEPKTDITYTSPRNPLDCINKEITINFRLNQGLYNYFMIFETIFYRICKPSEHEFDPVFYIELLNEDGKIVSKILYTNVYIDGIEGIEFDYKKIDRNADSFNVTFKFDNIDFEFLE